MKNIEKVLFIDHDDTVVDSQVSVHYPAFVSAITKLRPNQPPLALKEYVKLNATLGFETMLRTIYQFNDEEIRIEAAIWKSFSKDLIPPVFFGLAPILEEFVAQNNKLVVYSANTKANIIRDYQYHFSFMPHSIIAFDDTIHTPKPARVPLLKWMHQHQILPNQCLILDDSIMMQTTAKRTNIMFLAANYALAAKPLWQDIKDVIIISEVNELKQYLLK